MELSHQLIISAVQEVDGPYRGGEPDPDNLFWSPGIPTRGSFVLLNKTIYSLLLPASTAWKVANRRWKRHESKKIWTTKWTKLWGSDLKRGSKIFLWRIIVHGIYTLDMAQKLRHGNGCCTVCPGTQKTPEHIFHSYLKDQRGWAGNALYFKPNPYKIYLVDTSSFIDILDSGLAKTPIGSLRLFVIYQTCWTLWLHRNNHI